MSELKKLAEKVEKQDTVSKATFELYRPDELVESYVNSIVRAKTHPLSFGLPTIDEELRGDIRGKVAAIIGYGGTRKSFIVTATPFQNSTGEIIGIVENFKDISERKQNEEELKRTKNSLENIIDSSLDCVVVADSTGNIEKVNNPALTQYKALG